MGAVRHIPRSDRPPFTGLVTTLVLLVCSANAQQAKPLITKVDPPSWFAALPSPMLLLRGVGLCDATFTVSDPGIHVTRTVSSPNGHWAMLWLDTQAALAKTVRVTAHNSAGTAKFDYTLAPRRDLASGPTGFSSRDVLYLIMPDRFADGDPSNNHPAQSPQFDRSNPHAYHGGNLKGVIDHLDYLQQLGVTAVWLTPILQNDPTRSDYHGYGATDMYAVEPRLGTLADYRRLADELHRRHMKLVFDDVPNHVGPGHVWVHDPPLPDWFHGSAAHHSDNKYIFGPITDPHAAPKASLDALDGWFVNTLPDMNQQNPVVAQYLTQNMMWWIEQVGIDGLRIDTFPYVQREFWQQYLGALAALYPRLTSTGEITTSDPTVNAYFAGGRTLAGVDTHLTTPFDYPLYYTLLDVLLKGKPMSQLEETLRQDWLYPSPQALVPFIGNHDQIRFLSQPGATPELLRLGFGLLMTLRGMPQLYAGDEIDMTGGEDPDNRRDFPGGFGGDEKNAFTAPGRGSEQAAMHDWVAALGILRAHTPALQTGLQQTVLTNNSSFAYVRTAATDGGACTSIGSMLIVLNRDPTHQAISIPIDSTVLEGCSSLAPVLGNANDKSSQPISGRTLRLNLPPFGFEVYALR
jgi:neopullulanase